MIIDHIMFDFWGLLPEIFSDYPVKSPIARGIYNFAVYYWNADWRKGIRYAVIFVFLALTGICCSFSKSNLKRGGKLLIVSYILTLVTFIGGKIFNDPDMMITFGILHSIAFSLLIAGLLMKFIKNKWFYLIIGLIMVSIGIYFEINGVYESYVGNNIILLTLKQMVGISVCGGDCAPLLFNGGQIFIGIFLGKLLYKDRKSLFNFNYKNNIVTFTGRHSLLIYLAHQIVVPLIMGIVLLICGFNLVT